MTDDQVDVLIARILLGGVSLSAGTVVVGGVWYLIGNGGGLSNYGHFHQAHGIGALLALPAPELVILAGLLMLIATPVARVLFSVFAFAAERDWMYVVFTLIVLSILLVSIFSGI
jgi:uncharacterized membrane protein